MDEAYVDWIVVADTPEKTDPRSAFVLCLVRLTSPGEIDLFNELLTKRNLRAYTDRSYGDRFWSRQPKPGSISLEEFKNNYAKGKERQT